MGARSVEAGFGLNALSVYSLLVFLLWKINSFKLLLLFCSKVGNQERKQDA